MAYRISVPQEGIKPMPSAVNESKKSTTGPPGNSWYILLNTGSEVSISKSGICFIAQVCLKNRSNADVQQHPTLQPDISTAFKSACLVQSSEVH